MSSAVGQQQRLWNETDVISDQPAEDRPEWMLDEPTKQTGRRGLAEARRQLQLHTAA